jgi:hypothetical protein
MFFLKGFQSFGLPSISYVVGSSDLRLKTQGMSFKNSVLVIGVSMVVVGIVSDCFLSVLLVLSILVFAFRFSRYSVTFLIGPTHIHCQNFRHSAYFISFKLKINGF